MPAADDDRDGWAARQGTAGLLFGVACYGIKEAARIPLAAVRLPAVAIHQALVASETLWRGYEQIAQRGADVLRVARNRAGPPAPAEPPIGAPPEKPPDLPPRADVVTRAATAAQHAAEHGEAEAGVSRDELPIPDFDHVTAGSLRGRLRRLSLDELRTLRDYEQAHAARLPILTMLENRIAKLELTPT